MGALIGTPVHLGIVGLGNWSRQIFQAVSQVPEAKITGCYSRHPDTKEEFASEFGCLAYQTYEHMTQDPEIEGIIIMSSNLAHEQDVMLAAARGKHVFVTKPISTTVAAGRRMMEAARRNKVILAVGHQTRREPALRKLKEILDAAKLGEVKLVEANYSTPNGLKIRKGDWRWSEKECPGGALIQIGIHVIDTLQYLFGQVSRVVSWQDRGGLKAQIAGITVTLFEFASGLRGYLGSSYVCSFSHWIRVYGTEQNAVFGELNGLSLTNDSWDEGEVWNNVAPPAKVGSPMPAIVEEIAEFVRCIRTGDSPEIGAEAALHNLAVVLAAVKSAELGEPVRIESMLED